MERMIKACLRYPTLTAILTCMIAFVGIQALVKMPRTEDPSITIRTGLVLAAYPGATSEQVEQQVTKTLEAHIFKFQEVRKAKTFSTSRPGVAIINVELEKFVKQPDLFWAKLRHELNGIRGTKLPPSVMGPIVNSDFGDTVAMLVAVRGDRYGYRELKDYADRIQDELRTVPEVGKIAIYGQQSEQIWVTSSLERMSQYFTDPMKIIGALSQRNVVQGAGSVATDAGKVPLHTTGAFNSEDEIRKVMVGQGRTGAPVYLGDFAQVERRYQDPEFLVRFDGQPAVMLSVEMQKGQNIVELGDKVGLVLERIRPLLPPDLKLDFVAHQPEVVQERMSGMGHEFLIAIICVVVVTVLLLPFRVALIAAMAIPVTMLSTVGAMNAIGVQLHQVSIAALILVLGIVVDDAIVIADNYVELLDRKVPRPEAAWRAAKEVLVPVLTATLTIIASFLPLLILSGSSGEFIAALPITVAVALSVSFLVAIFLTPLLCRTFIHQGLHDHDADPDHAAKKTSALDLLQAAYQKAIARFMARPALAVGLGVGAVVAGLALFRFVPQQFFPSAERNQFVIDLWMPQGSRIEATDAVMKRLETALRAESDVAHFASFVGQSAPRFYYNVNPQQPDLAYGQLIVNTRSAKVTPKLVATFRERFAQLVPEGIVIVKELQQGAVMEAPLELRISGMDTAQLKVLGRRVEDILRSDARTQFVHTDHFNDAPRVDVNLNTELASRLGITHANVSRLLAGAFDGTPVSTFWEGDRAIHLVLRSDEDTRKSFEDVRGAYVGSPISQSRVPLRAVADLEAAWQTSRIVRRNGVPTLTVRAFPRPGMYAADLLKTAQKEMKKLQLPEGYRFEVGGEKANQMETFPEMVVALSIGLLAIFLILMIQFRNLREPLVVMASIPLSLFGVVFGLVVTRNPFGFTAFMGMISLSGIVVRNAIILVDYIKEKLREGCSLEEAATQAGERRLRPIFLTTMAAAVGVTPMILSGSKLWSPLASVLAVGLIFSMFFTLLVVPVIYVLVFRRTGSPVAPLAGLLLVLGLAAPAQAQEPLKLTLEQAIAQAQSQSPGVKIARARLAEAQAKRRTARADYLPQLSTDAMWLKTSGEQLVKVPKGALGTIPGLGPFPTGEMNLGQGDSHILLHNVTLGQPLTQLWKVHQGVGVATAEERIAEAELKQMEEDIALKTRQVYFGILIAEAKRNAAEAGVAAGEAASEEARKAVATGAALDVIARGAKVQLLDQRHKRMSAEDGVSDLRAELKDLLGLGQDASLSLTAAPPRLDAAPKREDLLQAAMARNAELKAAKEKLEKGRFGLAAGRADYIPEVSAFARHTYQEGVPFLRHRSMTVGLTLSWNLFDWGKRQGVIGQRAALVSQAEENLRRVKHRVEIDLDKGLRKLETARLRLEVAEEVCAVAQEKARLAVNQGKVGLISDAKVREAQAQAQAAEADQLAARFGVDLALAELEKLTGGR